MSAGNEDSGIRFADLPAVLAAPVPEIPMLKMAWTSKSSREPIWNQTESGDDVGHPTDSNPSTRPLQQTPLPQRRLSLTWQLPGGPGSPVLALHDFDLGRRGSRRGSASLLRSLLEECSTRDPSIDPAMSSVDLGIPYAAKENEQQYPQVAYPPTPMTLTAIWDLPLPDSGSVSGPAAQREKPDGSGGESEPVSEF